MEFMQINVLSLREHNGKVVARARADAPRARIWLELTVPVDPGAGQQEKWQAARDEALKYLDPA